MALRVLLADESSTLKKVFVLALRDYAAEVSNVNSGVDVLSVAQSFKPDIIFVDVLLPKKNGYDACAEVKTSAIKSIPVVLLWSPFMDMDEDKYQASKADDRLEKPFDVDALRKVIQKWVPKTKTQKLSQFLKMPQVPEIEEPVAPPPAAAPPRPPQRPPSAPMEQKKPVATKPSAPPPPPPSSAPPASEKTGEWSMDQFAPISEFEAEAPPVPGKGADEDFVHLRLVKEGKKKAESSGDEDLVTEKEEPTAWEHRNINDYKINVDSATLDGEDADLPIEFISPPEDEIVESPTSPRHQGFDRKNQRPKGEEVIEFTPNNDAELEVDAPQFEAPTPDPAVARTAISEAEIERYLRSASKEVIESVVWKVVPELAQQIIERELERLLAERSHFGERT